MALLLDGRDDKVQRSALIAFGSRYGVRPPAIEAMLDELCRRARPWLGRLSEIGLTERKTRHLHSVIEKRIRDLAG